MIDKTLGVAFGFLIQLCYNIMENYGLAIILFTLLTKIILLPVSIWVQRNSIAMVRLMPELNNLKIKYFGDKDTIGEEQQALYKRERYHPLLGTLPMLIQLVLLIGVISGVRNALGDGAETILAKIPSVAGGFTMLMPLAAGLSALLLSLAQNRLNPLQREQSRGSQLFTNGISIAISLLLGAFVPLGVGLYWIFSNLFTILQQLLLNIIIPPKKHIDYEALAESKKELDKLNAMGLKVSPEDKRREKEDYKRFFSIANKHLVFYSEKSGFYKYFQNVIEYLLIRSNIVIHYITNDPDDQIFTIAEMQPRIKPYYISEKRLITLMMKMDADMVVMTTPDLDNLYIKRSYVRKDIEYIYMPHGIGSTNLLLRRGALDHFDTIFCTGQAQVDELREEETVYSLPAKNLIPCGYGLLDKTMEAYKNIAQTSHKKPQILIAPSWQPDNILETCIYQLLDALLPSEYRIFVRPHPEFIKRYPSKIEAIIERYHERFDDDFILQLDFSSNETVFQSDILITDWSTICYEYSFATKRPTIFINTPMKVMNPEYKKLSNVPFDISVRNKMGASLLPNEIAQIPGMISHLLDAPYEYAAKIDGVMASALTNLGHSGEVGGKYILTALKNRKRSEKSET